MQVSALPEYIPRFRTLDAWLLLYRPSPISLGNQGKRGNANQHKRQPPQNAYMAEYPRIQVYFFHTADGVRINLARYLPTNSTGESKSGVSSRDVTIEALP